MTKILIADDEPKICEMIEKYLKAEGYASDRAHDGETAVYMAKNNVYDLILMDVMMPETDGFSAASKIRGFTDTPIIMISARGETYDRIHGFEQGADDYIVKPFSLRELMLRINAVLRRGVQNKPNSLKCRGLEIDFTAHSVTLDGVEITLSPKEFELLVYLVKNKGIVLKRENILNAVWGYDFEGDDRTLNTHIKHLRSKLKDMGDDIVTVRGVGYRFD